MVPTDNPYAGTENELQWQAGYDAGITSPGGVPSPPLVLEQDQMTVWSEGALAGFEDGQSEGFQTPFNPPPHGEQPESWVQVAIHDADTGIEVAMAGVELWKFATVASKTVFSLPSLPLGAFMILLSLESAPPPTVTDQFQFALQAKCDEIAQSDVFAPLCRNDDHSNTGDWFFDNGYWHGALQFSFWPAYQEAVGHFASHPDAILNVGVAHYTNVAPDGYEFVILQ